MKLITGRAGTGKTTEIFRRIAAKRDSGKRQILIVPELASHEYERMLAQATENKGARYAEVLTFRRIANRVFSEAGGLADTILTPAGRLLVLYEAVRRSADVLQLYRGAVRKPEVLQDILQVMDEMKCNGIAPEDMLRAAGEAEGHLSAKLYDLGHISTVYEALTTDSLPDPRDQLTKIAERLPESTLFDNAEVYLDRFDDWNKQELDILAVLLHKNVPITAALTGDTTQPELFPEAAKAEAKLRALASRCGHKLERERFTEMVMPRTQSLAILEHYGLETVAESFENTDNSVQLHAAGDIFSECEYAAAYVRRLLRTTDARRRDIVVTARNFDQYAPMLELLFDRYDIPVFMSEKHDILQKPVLALVGAALHTIIGGWRYEDIFSYLKTGFAGLSAEECDELENYAVFRHIRGNQWKKPFTGHPDSFTGEIDEKTQEVLLHLNALREKAVSPLLCLQEKLEQAVTAAQYVQALYDFLEQIHAPETIAERADIHEAAGRIQTAEEYRQLWEILVQALEQFAWVQGDARMEADTFVTLLGLVLTEYDVGTIPVSLDRVTCGSIDRVCRTGIPHLIVLGVNDGILPSTGDNNGILTEHDRNMLLGMQVELETGDDRIAQELAAMYRVLASAKDSLLLSWCSSAADGEMRPSFLIGTVRHLLNHIIETSENSQEHAYRLEAERPRFDLACRGAASDISPAAQAAYAAETIPIVPMTKAMRGPLHNTKILHALYGDKIRVTASRVDAFYRCQYAYFLRFGLQAKERRRASFDAPETGTFLHFVLEHSLKDMHDQYGANIPDHEIVHQLAKKWTMIYVETQLGGLEQHSARFRHLFRRLCDMVKDILDNVLDEMACSDFSPIDFELDFSRHGDLPPITLESEDGLLEMHGKVDRVDAYLQDGTLYIRVVDYKSGYKRFELSDLWYGLNIQLLLYLFAIEQHGLHRYRMRLAEAIDTIIPAGALYVPAHDAIVHAKRDTDAEELDKLRKKQLRRSGLLLDERAVIDAMEHGITKEGVYLPIGFLAKSGEVNKASQSSIASLEKMGKLRAHIRKVLQEMGKELMQGNMTANPIRRGPMEDTCAWCPYHGVCRFDPTLGDKPHTIAKMKSEEFWESIDRELEGGELS